MYTPQTLRPFWLRLAWSLFWLQMGEWPDRDEHGVLYLLGSPEYMRRVACKYLAEGWSAAIWVLKGDLDHIASSMKLNNSGSLCPCSCCKANKSDMPWTDFRTNAIWSPTIWSVAAWIAAHPNRISLFRFPGLTALNYIPDLMHGKYGGADA